MNQQREQQQPSCTHRDHQDSVQRKRHQQPDLHQLGGNRSSVCHFLDATRWRKSMELVILCLGLSAVCKIIFYHHRLSSSLAATRFTLSRIRELFSIIALPRASSNSNTNSKRSRRRCCTELGIYPERKRT